MTHMLRNLLVSLVVSCPLTASAAGWTDDVLAPGRGASQSFRAMQGPVTVRPLDNSTRNVDLAARLVDALRQHGIAVADDAPLLLEFQTAIETDPPRGDKRALLELPPPPVPTRDRAIERSGSADTVVDSDSTLRSSQTRKPAMLVRYTLRATVSERQGPRLWEGYTEYGDIVQDENRLYATMASLIASMVGTNSEGRFSID